MKDLCAAVVHPYRQRYMKLAQRPSEQLMDSGIQLQELGGLIQLLLSDPKGIWGGCEFDIRHCCVCHQVFLSLANHR